MGHNELGFGVDEVAGDSITGAVGEGLESFTFVAGKRGILAQDIGGILSPSLQRGRRQSSATCREDAI